MSLKENQLTLAEGKKRMERFFNTEIFLYQLPEGSIYFTKLTSEEIAKDKADDVTVAFSKKDLGEQVHMEILEGIPEVLTVGIAQLALEDDQTLSPDDFPSAILIKKFYEKKLGQTVYGYMPPPKELRASMPLLLRVDDTEMLEVLPSVVFFKKNLGLILDVRKEDVRNEIQKTGIPKTIISAVKKNDPDFLAIIEEWVQEED